MGVRFALVAGLLAAVSPAAAQSVDHLTIVAPAAPGGGWDQTARALQHVVDRRRLARVVEVQNVPGAAGTIGLSQFVDARRGSGDAVLVTGLVMLGATLWNSSPVSMTQATPLARLTGEYEVLAVPAASPLRDLRSVLEAFRRRPEAFAWGGGSAGGTDHILAGLIAEAAGVDPQRVNYVAFSGGGEAVAALLGGHVSAGISGYSEFAAHIDSGRLRAIAISSPARVPGIGVPTLTEAGVVVEISNWRGLLAPAGISAGDRARLAALVRDVAQSAEWRQMLTDRGWADQYLDADAFAAFLETERSRFAAVIGRLRRPAQHDRILTGRRLFPTAVGLGAAVIVLLLARRTAPQWRWRRREGAPVLRSEVLFVLMGLVVFAALLRPLGFAAAATALFVITARAFERLGSDPAPAPAWHTSDPDLGSDPAPTHAWHTSDPDLAPRLGLLIVAVVFCALVDYAFRHGLDLPLPSGTVWSWMR
jgi:putative tricarboxylic transport membrane protein